MDETFTNFVKLVGRDKAREFIQGEMERFRQNRSAADAGLGSTTANRDMRGYTDLIETLGGLNKANQEGLVTTIDALQPSQEKKADRNIRVMQGAADAEGSIVLPMQQGRKEQLQMLLDAQKAGNTGRMLDRIIRGAALAGAMFN
jgi:hypothetical protein